MAICMPVHNKGCQVIIAGTGHRPDKLAGGYTPTAQQALVLFAMQHLRVAKPELVISGMAQGWDQALAQAAQRMGLPYDAYVPFHGQEALWPEEAQQSYRFLLGGARGILVCSPGGFSPVKMQVRNVKMVENCTVVLALWNGTPGGTANCIRVAQATGKPWVNVWPSYCEMLKTGHLPVVRSPEASHLDP